MEAYSSIASLPEDPVPGFSSQRLGTRNHAIDAVYSASSAGE